MEDFDKIKDEAIRFFSPLYKKEPKGKLIIENLFSKKLESWEADALEQKFTDVMNVVISMEEDKSSSPNRFTMALYHK